MKIYTKTGDTGETSLYGGQRRSKADLRIEAYGQVDELQAVLGVADAACTAYPQLTPVKEIIAVLQRDCFIICCELSRPSEKVKKSDPVLASSRVEWVEGVIDSYEEQLPQLRQFIVQGGSLPAANLFLARAVARRAERVITLLLQKEPVSPTLIRYMNRLSDLLFVLARSVNHILGEEDTPVH
jgi:cob(I)alamin adenosyltransferase